MNESASLVCLIGLLFGVIAGLRSMTAPTAITWGVHLGWFHLGDGWLAFLGNDWTRWIVTLLALVELVADQLPTTPHRTTPLPFGGRIVLGALSGAAVGSSAGVTILGGVAGALGAVIGTLGGHRLRARLAAAFHNDHPAAFIEDAIAIGGAVLLGMAGR